MVTNPGLQAEGGWYFTYFFGLQPLLLPVLIILLISKHVLQKEGVCRLSMLVTIQNPIRAEAHFLSGLLSPSLKAGVICK